MIQDQRIDDTETAVTWQVEDVDARRANCGTMLRVFNKEEFSNECSRMDGENW
jgi:hypothetical protein